MEFKNNPSGRLSFERCFRPDATVQTEVTMGDITESRPVNVSFSFFYINSLPISNWNTTPPLLFLSKHIDTHARTHIYTHTLGHTHTVGHASIHPRELWEHLEELIQCTDKRFLESTNRTIREASNSPPLLTQTHTHTRTHTHLLAAEVKARSDEQREQRASLCTQRYCST